MYYLRKEPYEITIAEIIKTDGEIIPERKYMSDDRAIYKDHNCDRFYRGVFSGLDGKYQGMRVYTCRKLNTIMELREEMFDYCGLEFDVYDENGKVELED